MSFWILRVSSVEPAAYKEQGQAALGPHWSAPPTSQLKQLSASCPTPLPEQHRQECAQIYTDTFPQLSFHKQGRQQEGRFDTNMV